MDDNENVIPKEYKNLNDFITNNKSSIGSKLETHQYANGKLRINFIVSDDNYDIFMKLYIKEVKTNPSFILEKIKDTTSLYFDFDIKTDNDIRLFDIEDLKSIVMKMNMVIKKYYDLDNDDDDDDLSSDNSERKKIKEDMLKCYILTKDEPIYDATKKKYSDGFHIHYANLYLNTEDKLFLFDKIEEKIKDLPIMKKLCSKTKNDVEDIFDKKIMSDTKWWYLYLSGKMINNGKDIGHNLYKIFKILDINYNECEIVSNRNLINLLSIRNPKIKKNGFIKTKYLNEITEIKNKLKGNKTLNVNDYFTDINEDNKSIKSETEKIIKEEEFNMKNILDKTIPSQIELAKKIVNILSEKRATDYGTWIAVGWALYNISPTLLNEFHIFSKKSKKYDKKSCNDIWLNCRNKLDVDEHGYKIGSLCRWALEDNKEEFDKIKFDETYDLFVNLDFTSENDQRSIIKNLYSNEFVCSDLEGQEWYHFENHRWHKLQKAQDLNNKLSDDFINIVAKISGILSVRGANANGQDSDKYIKKSKDTITLIKSLKSNDFREKLIKSSAYIFHDRYAKFNEKLNENQYIIGFNNGVYDLEMRKFRNGTPDDYLTFTTGYNYVEYSLDHEYVINIEKFFKQILKEDDLILYFMCYLSSIVKGGNTEQIIMFWIGYGGSNGKGTITNLLDYAFGDYFSTVGIELLTRKTGKASDATPALADKKSKRLLSMQEVEAGDRLQVAYMKSLTGEDKILTRGLYKDPFYFIPQFKMIISCNVLPDIVSDDGGTWRRIKVVEFTQRFVENPKKPNEHKKDGKLKENLKKWKGAFMWLLLNKYYPIYAEKGLESLEPECVSVATRKYKEDSNFIIDFINTHYVKTENTNEKLKLDDVWATFQEWFKSINGNSTKLPFNSKKFKELLTLMDFKITTSYIQGITVKSDEY
jgi:P4 family phage/plasmid primase-like protien